MYCYLVGMKERANKRIYTLLLSKNEVASLLFNVDEEKYEIGEIVKTYSEKRDSILDFCKKDTNLETGIDNVE